MPHNQPSDPAGSLHPISNSIRNYDWGSYNLIAQLLGRKPSGLPEAEMWLGAHASDPSILTDSGQPLDAYVQANPEVLGHSRTEFPFLMKLLAANQPLSLQVHPNLEQARRGYERENAAGIPIDAPQRSYKDAQHKPEILVALTPFEALCGFRCPTQTAADLDALLRHRDRLPAADQLLALLNQPNEQHALRDAFELLLNGKPETAELVAELRDAAQHSQSLTANTVILLGDIYGDDPGVLAATMLNRIVLSPGQAIYLEAGNIHAYLNGLGIEAMAPSDNVLRCGLTTKHMDIPGLMEIVNFAAITPSYIEAQVVETPGMRVMSYLPPVPEFSIHILDVTSGTHCLSHIVGPSVLVVTEGTVEVTTGSNHIRLNRGDSIFQAAGSPLQAQANNPARIVLTTTGMAPRDI